MKKIFVFMLGVLCFLSIALAADTPSPKAIKAQELVKKAVAFYKANGLEATIKAVNDTKGQFVDGEYYIFIHTFDGINIARGDGNKKRLGSRVLDDRDPNGKLFVQEMIKTVRKDGFGWESYGFKNALTGKIQTKHSYLEKIDGALIGCGYFD
ncbi:MAG: cache domain-containing protein [Candidatus Omnitrophica bacterium]|nr:cache domain-containing protein [Candidatus Omnitrophota bacterium]